MTPENTPDNMSAKTLFLSDLDGTLLKSDLTLSRHTCDVLAAFTRAGHHFSYATARSIETASRVTAGLNVGIPVIVHNGAFIVNSATRRPLWSAQFSDREKADVFAAFRRRGLFPLVYSVIGGRNRFSYLRSACGRAQWAFVLSRSGHADDRRAREVFSPEQALEGTVYYFTCIGDTEEALREVRSELEERYFTIFSRDIYTGAPWLEVLPKGTSKATAAKKLMELLGCGRLICFGDEMNDMPMFRLAQEKYAVGNAAPALKEMATAVLGTNDEDAVATFLERFL